MCRKISAHVDGRLSGGSRVRRPGSEDPHRREQKFRNIFSIKPLSVSEDLGLLFNFISLFGIIVGELGLGLHKPGKGCLHELTHDLVPVNCSLHLPGAFVAHLAGGDTGVDEPGGLVHYV